MAARFLSAQGRGCHLLTAFYAASLYTVTVTHTRVHVLCKARFWCLVCLNQKAGLYLFSLAGSRQSFDL